MAKSEKTPGPGRPRRPPATTAEAREQQMVSLAFDLAARQLADGTASSQVITHYLKLGTSREKLEQEKLKQENILLKAKADQIASGARIEALYSDALKAMGIYSGQDEFEELDE